MLKTLITLMRGGAARAGEEIADRNALLLLDQQIRDATAGVARARRALAVAIASDAQEGERITAVKARIADLEARACAALTGGREDLARQAAEAIAALEADRDAALAAKSHFAGEATRLRAHVAEAERRLAEVERGRRTARAAEAVRDLRKGWTEDASLHRATLKEAEDTLARLRGRQKEAAAADDVLATLDPGTAPERVVERLAGEGFGPALRTSADDVLARLRAGLETH